MTRSPFPSNPYDCFTCVYVYRDGNEHEFFLAFDEEAAVDAELEAMADDRFGPRRSVAFFIFDIPA